MTWRDQLRKASFRGVEFEVNSSDYGGGRRGNLREYPLRDTPYFEDLGRKGRAYPIEGFVIGRDYMAARDRLIVALEQGGPGQLVHPYFGTVNVAVDGEFRVRESSAEGGMARFTIQFVETGEDVEPVAADDKAAQVKAAADNLDLKAAAAFAERVVATGFPEFTNATAVSVAKDAAEKLAAAAGASDYADTVASFIAAANTLFNTPADFGSQITGLISGFSDTTDAPDSTISALEAMSADDFLADVPRDTASRQQETTNAQASAALIRRSAMAAAARNLADRSFVSVSEANTAMVDFADMIDTEVERDNVSDEEYTAARDLTAKVVADLSARLGGLPRVRSITLPGAKPAIVLAYELYQDVSRDSEIANRNDIIRPGFLPSDSPIEVLSE